MFRELCFGTKPFLDVFFVMTEVFFFTLKFSIGIILGYVGKF